MSRYYNVVSVSESFQRYTIVFGEFPNHPRPNNMQLIPLPTRSRSLLERILFSVLEPIPIQSRGKVFSNLPCTKLYYSVQFYPVHLPFGHIAVGSSFSKPHPAFLTNHYFAVHFSFTQLKTSKLMSTFSKFLLFFYWSSGLHYHCLCLEFCRSYKCTKTYRATPFS